MVESGFENNNLFWQWELVKRRFWEWLVLNLPKVNLPKGSPFPFSLQFVETLFWIITLILLAWIIWRFSPFLMNLWLTFQKVTDVSQTPLSPAPSRQYTVAELLKQAQQLQQEGQFTDACCAVYMAMLQRLHDSEMIKHDPSRTDDEYLQLTQNLAKAMPYQTLLEIHENLCFGNRKGSSELYTMCQKAYQEIDPQ